MTQKILLTGGSGFIASHILSQLLSHPSKPTVLTTVRTQSKADPILSSYPEAVSSGRLRIHLTPDISDPAAFAPVIAAASPDLTTVIHTASPFHFRINDPKTDLIDPAVNGTTGILRAITSHPDASKSVKRVVITSSFAAILDEAHISDPETTFSEKSWNPVTIDDIHRSSATAYRASKTLAEKAAWEFATSDEYISAGAKFSVVTVNPPMVYGPIIHSLGEAGLKGINTSNQRIVDLLSGTWKENGIPDVGPGMLFVDVRDVATAHVKAAFEDGLAGKRLFTTAGFFSNREIAEVVRRNFGAEYAEKLPEEGKNVGGELPDEKDRFRFYNSQTTELLGIEWIGLDKSISDTVTSLKEYGA